MDTDTVQVFKGLLQDIIDGRKTGSSIDEAGAWMAFAAR